MVTGSLRSDKAGSSREASLANRSGKPRSWSVGPELLDLVRVERDWGRGEGEEKLRGGKAQSSGMKDRADM